MTPRLVTWSGMLTADGEALAAYLDATGAAIPPAPSGSLITAAAHYFAGLTDDEAAQLWAQYRAAKAHSEIVLS